jgi:hypothetical protein
MTQNTVGRTGFLACREAKSCTNQRAENRNTLAYPMIFHPVMRIPKSSDQSLMHWSVIVLPSNEKAEPWRGAPPLALDCNMPLAGALRHWLQPPRSALDSLDLHSLCRRPETTSNHQAPKALPQNTPITRKSFCVILRNLRANGYGCCLHAHAFRRTQS